MKDLCVEGNYAAVSCNSGTFTLDSIELLLEIHSLCDVKHDVKNEQKWLNKQITVPNTTCSYSREDLASKGEKIFNNPINNSPLENNHCILASDLATVAGTSWLNFSIINGIVELFHRESEHTAALILNNVALVKSDEYVEYIENNIRPSTKYLVLFANVGKSKSGEVFLSKPGNPGYHWTLLYVDLVINKSYYCDTICWAMPKGLKTAVGPFMEAIYKNIFMTLLKSLGEIIQAHVESSGSHLCF